MSKRSESFKLGIKAQLKETFKDATTFFNAYENTANFDYGLAHVGFNHMTSEEGQFRILKERLRSERLELGDTSIKNRMSCFNIRKYEDLARLMPAIKYGIERQIETHLDEMQDCLDSTRGKYTFQIDLNKCIGTTVAYMGNNSFAEFPCSSLKVTLMPSRSDRMFDILTLYPAPNRREQIEIDNARLFTGREKSGQNKMRPDLRGEPKGEILPLDVSREKERQRLQNEIKKREASESISGCKRLINMLKDVTVSGATLIANKLDNPMMTSDDKRLVCEIFMQKPIARRENIVDIVTALPPEGQSPELLVRCMEEKPQDFIQALFNNNNIVVDEDELNDEEYGIISKSQLIDVVKSAYEEVKIEKGAEDAEEYLSDTLIEIGKHYKSITSEQLETIYIGIDAQTFVSAVIADNFIVKTAEPLLQGIKVAYEQIAEESGVEEAEKYLNETLEIVGEGEDGIGIVTDEQAMQLRKDIASEQEFTQKDVSNIMEQLGEIPNELETDRNESNNTISNENNNFNTLVHIPQEYDVEEIGA